MFEKAVLYGLVVKKLTLLCGVLESGKLLGAVRSSRERERRPRRRQLSAALLPGTFTGCTALITGTLRCYS